MKPASRPELTMPWFRVIEMWLVLVLLAGAVIGSFALLAAALRHPDLHLTVPNEVPRSSVMPPQQPAAVKAASNRSASPAP
ncbi:MAG: hypothetical protein ABIW82_02715 [Dokdonella sp.]